jgi:molybdenum-dependent DNA-binding transcriptional regulator ModE
MTKKKPRWVHAFLRALERTGVARVAAEDAGVDYTTAYARRRAHADFASDWAWVLQAYAERVEREQAEELAALRSAQGKPSPGSPAASPTSPACGRGELGDELIASGGQLKRAGHDRWGKRKQEALLAELAAHGNFRQASKAVGISYEAVRKRRRRNPSLEKACKAAIEACRARIPEFLAGAAAATFDPDAIADSGTNPFPKVTIADAIRIAQLGGSKKQEPDELPDPFAEEAARMTPDDVAALREKLVRKLRRMRERDMPEWIAQGWSFDEEHDHMVPPGWTKADNAPEEPGDEV